MLCSADGCVNFFLLVLSQVVVWWCGVVAVAAAAAVVDVWLWLLVLVLVTVFYYFDGDASDLCTS